MRTHVVASTCVRTPIREYTQRLHTSAYVSINPSAYVSIRNENTYVSIYATLFFFPLIIFDACSHATTCVRTHT
jgi:hypothetical protein